MRTLFNTTARGFAACIAVALIAGTLTATAVEAGARGWQGIFSYNGNEYTVRRAVEGDTIHLRVYRRSGDQWEHYSATTTNNARLQSDYGLSLSERIYVHGTYRGQNTVDLDNSANTDMNRNGNY